MEGLTTWPEEGVAVRVEEPGERDREVALLDDPWVGDEGPLAAAFRRGAPAALAPRGLAFDRRTTVVWDECRVEIVTAAPPAEDVVAVRTAVRVRDRFAGPARLERVDYLRRGRLLASRYLPEGEGDA